MSTGCLSAPRAGCGRQSAPAIPLRQAADGTDLAACWLRLEASDGNDFSLAEAIRYLEAGHAQGKVVITVEYDNKT
ncbi:MAG: hypothetical protein E6J31_05330 [Chloroflexi bacterium]|nr:MAG: hypothetical protein E6J31_05330 [Chloroflexota bacterium]